MINLIKKEFLLQKKMLWFGLFYTIFFFVAFNNPIFKQLIYIMVSFGISYITIIGSVQAEYKDSADIVMNSLPLSRRDIVKSKYLAVFVFAGIALLMVAGVGLVFHFFPEPLTVQLITGTDALVALISVIFLAAFTIPAYLKTGAQWLRVVNVVFFMLIFFAPAQIIKWIMTNQETGGFPPIIQVFQHSPWLPGLFGITIVLMLLIISYLISLRIYLNKDF